MNSTSFRVPSIEEIKEARKKRIVIYMITVFGDESHDEKSERIFVVAGVIGTQGDWDRIEPIWLKETKGIPFHASECESGKGTYKNVPHQECLDLVKKLTQTIIGSGMGGFGVGMDLRTYRDQFSETFEHWPYMFCFQRCLKAFAKWVSLLNPPLKVSFCFHTNVHTDYNAGYLYDLLRTKGTEEYTYFMADEIRFASNETIGVQVSDLWAREIMKFCDSRILEYDKRNVRESIKELSDTKRFHIRFYDKDCFKDFKSRFEEIGQEVGMNKNLYVEWLSNKRLNNTLSNALKYVSTIKDEGN